MTGDHDPRPDAVSTTQLGAALEPCLSEYAGKRRRITGLQRERSLYSTSFSLEALEVQLDGGDRLGLMFKDLGRSGMLETASLTKPGFLYEPLREIETYRRILSHQVTGTATCYGAITDAVDGRYWLFLEHVSGRELYQIGDVSVWGDVARWLASLHDSYLLQEDELRQRNPHLISYDASYYRRWFSRAQEFTPRNGSEAQRRFVERLVAVEEAAVAPLARMPTTFVHGDLYASNVLVTDAVSPRICAVDWEMAGLGSGLLDVAALCAGWGEAEQRSIALSYRSALPPRGGWPPDEDEFLTLLDFCRLLLAVQWLGWSPQWSPPLEHAHDWLAEAVNLGKRLGLS